MKERGDGTMKRWWIKGLALLVSVTCMVQFAYPAVAEAANTEYVQEVILSYGKTAEDAKQWLTDNGYAVVDTDLNQGADDVLSKKRAVYLGYRTTDDPAKALTDMKVMNMAGGYSVQDYQKMLSDQKTELRKFISNFLITVEEYRENYRNQKPRALQAYTLLNLIRDDDTERLLGDLFLVPLKEEYTEAEFAALSKAEQKTHLDFTTFLMQGNRDLVQQAEQLLASAADTTGTLWTERYLESDSYDDMLEEQVRKTRDVNRAEKTLATLYDHYASQLALKVSDYREFLKPYLDSNTEDSDTSEVSEETSVQEADAEDTGLILAAAQAEALRSIPLVPGDPEEKATLLDLFVSDEYDVTGEDKTLLYPLISVLSPGQRAGLEFMSLPQLVVAGMNDEEAILTADEKTEDLVDELPVVSAYSGVNREVFGNDVALTNDAIRRQNSSEDRYADFEKDVLSTGTLVLYGCTAVAAVTSAVSAVLKKAFVKKPELIDMRVLNQNIAAVKGEVRSIKLLIADFEKHFMPDQFAARIAGDVVIVDRAPQVVQQLTPLQEQMYKDYLAHLNKVQSRQLSPLLVKQEQQEAQNAAMMAHYNRVSLSMNILTYGCLAAAVVLAGFSVWQTYEDLKNYYNADFIAIPSYMVDETEQEDGSGAFVYYAAAKCNRNEMGLVSDNAKVLKDIGDLNGDVGKQWLALYTTCDVSAGDPITTDFVVKVGSSSVVSGKQPLSLFGKKDAQNLTDKQNNMTYSDDQNGVYLYFGQDKNVRSASVFGTGALALSAGLGLLVGVLGTCLAFVARKKKSPKKA